MTKTKTTAKTVKTARKTTSKASPANDKKTAVVQSEPAKKDAATFVVCNPFDPDYITKIIDAVAVNIATNDESRKAFAKVVKARSNGKVLIVTDKELERIIKKRTNA